MKASSSSRCDSPARSGHETEEVESTEDEDEDES